jgi:hypothetical protein
MSYGGSFITFSLPQFEAARFKQTRPYKYSEYLHHPRLFIAIAVSMIPVALLGVGITVVSPLDGDNCVASEFLDQAMSYLPKLGKLQYDSPIYIVAYCS